MARLDAALVACWLGAVAALSGGAIVSGSPWWWSATVISGAVLAVLALFVLISAGKGHLR